MLYKNLHWQRGIPAEAGTYLVYDDRALRVRLAVVTCVAPFTFLAAGVPVSGSWAFRAYLGPLDGVS